MSVSFPGRPSIEATESNPVTITYPEIVDPSVFGLDSFSTTYLPNTLLSFDMTFNDTDPSDPANPQTIIVRFTRGGPDGTTFTAVEVIKGVANVSFSGNSAAVTIQVTKGNTVYNILSYNVVITREELEGSVFYRYTSNLVLSSTAITKYGATLIYHPEIPGSFPDYYEFRVGPDVPVGTAADIFFRVEKSDSGQYELKFYRRVDDIPSGSFRLLLVGINCNTGTIIPGFNIPFNTTVSQLAITPISNAAPNPYIATFNITTDTYVAQYSITIDSSNNCADVSISDPIYRETRRLFSLRGNFALGSTSTLSPGAEPVPPYLFIDFELTNDKKNIASFRVRAATSQWECTFQQYYLPFASVLLGYGASVADKVDFLIASGFHVSRNLMFEYMLLRVTLSAILGIAPFCCFSVEFLRQRYWLPFRAALLASEFAPAIAFFDDPRYNLVGYEKYFEC